MEKTTQKLRDITSLRSLHLLAGILMVQVDGVVIARKSRKGADLLRAKGVFHFHLHPDLYPRIAVLCMKQFLRCLGHPLHRHHEEDSEHHTYPGLDEAACYLLFDGI